MYHYIAVILIVLLLIWYLSSANTVQQPAHGGDGVRRNWWVLSDYQNSADAAKLLATVNSRLITFMRVLKQKYHVDETDDMIAIEGPAHLHATNAPNNIYNMVNHLLDNYNPDKFYENDMRRGGETSYTMNKGDAMYLCLRSKEDPTQLVSPHALMFVMLHECAHIANYDGWGHDKRFWSVFKWLLYEAAECGVYDPIDYSKQPFGYCGLTVAYSPLFDNGLPSLWQN